MFSRIDIRRRNSKRSGEGRPRYRLIGGRPSVELQLRNPQQLFDQRDPAPFRERDLDDDAVRYILSSYRDLKDQRNVQLSLYFASLGEFESKPRVIAKAIHSFFEYEAHMKRRELRETLRTGFKSLGIGIVFLFICTAFAKYFGNETSSLWTSMVKESLFILWWVCMWKPISIFLYDWWPLYDAARTYEELAEIDVDVQLLRPELLRDGEAVRANEGTEPSPQSKTVSVPIAGTINGTVTGSSAESASAAHRPAVPRRVLPA